MLLLMALVEGLSVRGMPSLSKDILGDRGIRGIPVTAGDAEVEEVMCGM